MTDITDTLKADSTQLNAIDFTAGPRTYTVSSVRVAKGSDQPVNIRLIEDADGREYRPSKSMRRVLAACWGPDSDTWTGRRLTLYCDPAVTWGGKAVGGIKIAAVSHIDAPRSVMLQESSSVRKPHKVEPLTESSGNPEQSPEPTAEQVAECEDVAALRAMWKNAGPERQAQIKARVDELNAINAPAEDALPIEEQG